MYTTLEQAKRHLQVDGSFTGDDAYITALIAAAEDAIALHIGVPLSDTLEAGALPPMLSQAVLLLVGNFYANREPVAYASAVSVPHTLDYLLELYRKQYCP